MKDHEELTHLVDTLEPEELDAHEELGGVYRAAGAIALSSYNGRIITSPVEGIEPAQEELVNRLLSRYADDRGFVEFPVLQRGTVDSIVVSASDVATYTLRRRKDAQTNTDVTYFSSFPS